MMIKKFLKIVLVFFCLILSWFFCAWLFPKIKVNNTVSNSKKTITIYVKSNGMHTDIVLPIKNNCYDWNSFFDVNTFSDFNEDYNFIALGWGDKGFYLNTPTMADLKAKTLVNAVFGLGSTAMHITYYKKIKTGKFVKKVMISESDYLNLISHITHYFELKETKLQLISHPSYGFNDNYYEAKGTYSLFKTCNVWTGNALKIANVPMGLWTPLEFGVMDNL